jgi:hypothetical protein
MTGAAKWAPGAASPELALMERERRRASPESRIPNPESESDHHNRRVHRPHGSPNPGHRHAR